LVLNLWHNVELLKEFQAAKEDPQGEQAPDGPRQAHKAKGRGMNQFVHSFT